MDGESDGKIDGDIVGINEESRVGKDEGAGDGLPELDGTKDGVYEGNNDMDGCVLNDGKIEGANVGDDVHFSVLCGLDTSCLPISIPSNGHIPKFLQSTTGSFVAQPPILWHLPMTNTPRPDNF